MKVSRVVRAVMSRAESDTKVGCSRNAAARRHERSTIGAPDARNGGWTGRSRSIYGMLLETTFVLALATPAELKAATAK